MTIIDTHAHLDHLDNLDEALRNAADAGVEAIMAISMDADSCCKNLEIVQQYTSPNLFLAMGMHPSEANLDDLERVKTLIKEHSDRLKAVGEIGLDFWYKWVRKDQEKKDEQRRVFQDLAKLAKELNLPAVVHSRGTWKECFETIKDIGLSKCVFHWYSGPLDVLERIIESGYFVSTTPSLAYSPESRKAIARAPIEQTLIETDCPVYFRNKETGDGFKAEPKDVLKTLKAYCTLKNLEVEDTVKIFNQNADKFFDLELGQ